MEEEIKKALEVLQKGGTILCPTDTIWGISCDATDQEAVEKILTIKGRDPEKGLIVLMDDEKWLNKYLKEVPAQAWDLIELSDKPITIIYDSPLGLAKNVTGTDNTAAIRICKDDFCKRLIYKFGKPIVSTSANLSGEVSPGSFHEISETIKKNVDHIVKLRQNESMRSIASSIVRIKLNGEIQVIRK